MKKIIFILTFLPLFSVGQKDNISGEWISKGDGYESILLFTKLKEDVYRFSFDSYRFSYDHLSGDTVRFLGEMNNPVFTVKIVNNKAYYNDDIQEFEEGWGIYREGEDRCDVYFNFKEDLIIVKTDFCHLIYGGFGVTFDGEYIKVINNSQKFMNK